MHEMSLTESMREVIEAQARAHGFSRVRTVWLEVGAFANVEPEAMAFCFDVVMKGSVAEGARLEIVRLPGAAVCLDCCRQVAIGTRGDPCPECGGHAMAAGGDALRIKELEVEEPDDPAP